MNPSVDLSTDTPKVEPVHKLRCSEGVHDAGGGGINVARVLHRLGAPCITLCPSGGPTGHWLETRMREEGLVCQFVPIAGETRVSFTVHEASTGQEYRFVMPGPTLSETEWRACVQTIEKLPAMPDIIVASGSLPPGVPVDIYAHLAELARAKGSRLVLDSSGPGLQAALTSGGVFMVKPNLRELGDFCGRKLQTPEEGLAVAKELVAQSKAEVVALTLGEQGAYLVCHEGAWFAPPLSVPIASAVGAGDSFVAGMVWGLRSQQPIEEAFAWGVAAGSAALITTGTGLCKTDDVQRLKPAVALQSL
ncbi:1-phosphofructokinase family hexose kinase [Hydrogenophaga sp. 5NK40-0174]